MKPLLITGATGFVARHLISQLATTDEWQVVGASRTPQVPEWLPNCEWLRLDIASWPETLAAIDRIRPAAIVHLAGQVRGSFAELARANVLSTAHLLHATRTVNPAARLVIFGSAAEYGAASGTRTPIPESMPCDPLAAYGSTKCTATELALNASRGWGARVSVVRPFNIVGAHMPSAFVAGALLDRIHGARRSHSHAPITVGRTDTLRDFVDVADLCRGVIQLLKLDESGEIYNLCSGRETSIAQLLDVVLSVAGEGLGWREDPALVRANDVLYSCGDRSKASARLGFEPAISLESSLRAAWHALTKLEAA